MSVSRLQLLASPGGRPGDSGFKLTGVAREGDGLCRVWLRRKQPWDRYIDPRYERGDWDVRCYTREDSAFAYVEDFDFSTLDLLGERYDFNGVGADLRALGPNGDPIYDRVLSWAKRATGATLAPVAPVRASTAAPEPAAPVPAESTAAPALDNGQAAPDTTPVSADVSDAWDELEQVAKQASPSPRGDD